MIATLLVTVVKPVPDSINNLVANLKKLINHFLGPQFYFLTMIPPITAAPVGLVLARAVASPNPPPRTATSPEASLVLEPPIVSQIL